MEPELITPIAGPEKEPARYEHSSEIKTPGDSRPEKGIEDGAERKELASEAAAAIADSSFPTTLPTPVVSDDSVVSDGVGAHMPAVANDDDLIEKEWVDKAKKIITETKEDPYSREKAVNKLQKEYQQKRYGRGLGEA